MQLCKYFLRCINISRRVVGLQHAQEAGLKPQRVVRFLLPDLTLKGWGELCAFWSEQTPGSQQNRSYCISFYKVRGFSHRKNFALEVLCFITACVVLVHLGIYHGKCRAQSSQTMCCITSPIFHICWGAGGVEDFGESLQLKTTAAEIT